MLPLVRYNDTTTVQLAISRLFFRLLDAILASENCQVVLLFIRAIEAIVSAELHLPSVPEAIVVVSL